MTHHKIILGSSTKMKEIPDEKVNLIVTSPPYWQLKNYNGGKNEIGQGNATYEDYLHDLFRVFDECVRVLAPDGKIAINIMPMFLSGNATPFKRRITKSVLSDFENFFYAKGNMFLQNLFIWDKRKSTRVSSWGSYPHPVNLLAGYPYEWIIVFSKAGKRPKVSKEIKEQSKLTKEEWEQWVENSFWEMHPASAKKEGHPAPFPEELPKRIIRIHSFVGDTILDPFGGSGTTGKVAKNLNRNSISYDINPEFIELMKRKMGFSQVELFGSECTLEVITRNEQEDLTQ